MSSQSFAKHHIVPGCPSLCREGQQCSNVQDLRGQLAVLQGNAGLQQQVQEQETTAAARLPELRRRIEELTASQNEAAAAARLACDIS